MKKCMICGWDESDESRFTCPACGEATWCSAPSLAIEETQIVAVTTENEPPKKRGPGRPRKQQPS